MLEKPDCRAVSHAQVPCRVHQQVRLRGHPADAPAFLRRLQNPAVIAALGNHARVAFPYPVVLVRVGGKAMPALFVQHVREPRVVPPGHLLHQRVLRPAHDELLPDGGMHMFRVERKPDFGAGFADGGAQDVQRAVGDAFRLLHPAVRQALHGLEAGHVVQPVKDKERAVGAADFRLQAGVEPAQPQAADLIVEQALHAVLDALLHLAGAEHADGLLHAQEQQNNGERLRLGAAAAAVKHLVAVRLKQPLEGFGYLRVNHRRRPSAVAAQASAGFHAPQGRRPDRTFPAAPCP